MVLALVLARSLTAPIHRLIADMGILGQGELSHRVGEGRQDEIGQIATDQAADELAKSCPADVSLTPVGRLQTLRKQLEAIGQAIKTVQPVLGRFYETFNDVRQQR